MVYGVENQHNWGTTLAPLHTFTASQRPTVAAPPMFVERMAIASSPQPADGPSGPPRHRRKNTTASSRPNRILQRDRGAFGMGPFFREKKL